MFSAIWEEYEKKHGQMNSTKNALFVGIYKREITTKTLLCTVCSHGTGRYQDITKAYVRYCFSVRVAYREHRGQQL